MPEHYITKCQTLKDTTNFQSLVGSAGDEYIITQLNVSNTSNTDTALNIYVSEYLQPQRVSDPIYRRDSQYSRDRVPFEKAKNCLIIPNLVIPANTTLQALAADLYLPKYYYLTAQADANANRFDIIVQGYVHE